MKKITLFFLSMIVVAATGFADNFVFENQTSYPLQNQKSKIAVQWASTAREVQDSTNGLMSGTKVNPDTLQIITQKGKINLTIPKKVEYFRVLVWSKGEGDPDFHTNWIEIVPNKTYTLKTDYLIPSVLMSGMGC